MKKIKPILKTTAEKYHICKWIIDHFPKDYEEHEYIEPFFSDSSVFLNKNNSKLEVINAKTNIANIFRSIRDEHKEFTSRLKRRKYSHIVFERATKQTEFEDYLDSSTNEFISVNMSKGGTKKNFLGDGKEKNWENFIDSIDKTYDRMKDVFILETDANDVLQAFNKSNTLCFINLESYGDLTEEEHIEIFSNIKNFKGKIIVSHKTCPLYKKLYKNWKRHEKKLSNGNESIWVNY